MDILGFFHSYVADPKGGVMPFHKKTTGNEDKVPDTENIYHTCQV